MGFEVVEGRCVVVVVMMGVFMDVNVVVCSRCCCKRLGVGVLEGLVRVGFMCVFVWFLMVGVFI